MSLAAPHHTTRPDRMRRASLCLLLLSSTALLWAQDKPAPAKPDPKQSVELQVYVVRCTNSHKRVDPELRGIAAELKQSLKYTGYTVEKQVSERRNLNSPLEIADLGVRKARITPLERAGDQIKMRCEFIRVVDKKKRDEPRNPPGRKNDSSEKATSRPGAEQRADDHDVARTTFSQTAGKFALQVVPDSRSDSGDQLLLAIAGR